MSEQPDNAPVEPAVEPQDQPVPDEDQPDEPEQGTSHPL